MRRAVAVACVLLVTGGMCLGDVAVAVPRLDGVKVDGRAGDWGDRGFAVAIMMPDGGGQFAAPADFDPAVRLGWAPEGLLVLAQVRDDRVVTAEDPAAPATRDCVEAYVGGEGSGYYVARLGASAGVDLGDSRVGKETRPALTAVTASRRAGGGYVVEALLPWANLGSGGIGSRLRVCVRVLDWDAAGDTLAYSWDPRGYQVPSARMLTEVRLAGEASPPVMVALDAVYEHGDKATIEVFAASDTIGKRLVLRDGDRVLADDDLVEGPNGRAILSAGIPAARRDRPYGAIAAVIDGRPASVVSVPADVNILTGRLLIDAKPRFSHAVFTGTELPSCDLGSGVQVLGACDLRVTYYDRAYNRVTSAEALGRYGAVIEIVPRSGARPLRRFQTLYRVGDEAAAWLAGLDLSGVTPEGPTAGLGIDPQVMAEHLDLIQWHLKDTTTPAWEDPSWAVSGNRGLASVLAYLSEMKSGAEAPTGVLADAGTVDRAWWLGLKRRLYGTDREFAAGVALPRAIEGPAAPVVREGSAEEAGVSPEAVAKVDALCQEWAGDTDEGFAVCVVKHGVIVLHKAYGQRDGRPMTVTDKSWMASITKAMSGTLMMLLVDQGLVDPDDEVTRFLPQLRDIKVAKPLTVRHLYTHTNGLWGHWGDWQSDFEEVIADYYPYLEVGKRLEYNGAGYALGGKIIENVSGETVPLFFKRHLLDPLGAGNTDVAGTCGDASSVPMDVAKIGQLLLNKGAYGDLRFFSEETFGKMLPSPMAPILGDDVATTWGLGIVPWRGEGATEQAFGHGAASSAIFRVDPGNDSVLVMTRNAAGRNYSTYFPRFLSAVGACLNGK